MRKRIFFTTFFLVGILILSEVSFRAYFYTFFNKRPFIFFDPKIKGVPYLQIDLTKIATKKIKPRIVIIGDYIGAHKSKVERTSYPQVLAEKLQNKYDVINTSTAFFSLPEELQLLKNKMLEYKPDVIVWGYVFNDLYVSNFRNVVVLLRLKKSLLQFKIITPLAIEALVRIRRMKNISGFYKKYLPVILKEAGARYVQDKSRKLLHSSLTELARIQKERNIPIIFVSIPIFVDFDGKENKFINDVVLGECQSAGLPCVSMLEVFKPYGVKAVKEEDGDIWHQNSLGNELIAEEIYKRIIRIPAQQ